MNNDFRPEVGRRFNLRGAWGGVLDCEVLAVEPLKTLSYTWDFAHDDAAFNLKSVVTFTLTPTRAGTRLRMEQAGFGPEQKQAYGGARVGWGQFLAKLEEVVGRGSEGGALIEELRSAGVRGRAQRPTRRPSIQRRSQTRPPFGWR